MQGGAYIDMYLAEMLRKSENGNEKTIRVKWERPGPPYDNPHQPVTLSITDHLHPGAVYQRRVCAENEIGSGPWSEWTEDVLIPGDAADVAAAVAAEEAAAAAAEAAEDDAEIDGEEDEDLAEFAAVLRRRRIQQQVQQQVQLAVERGEWRPNKSKSLQHRKRLPD